MASDQVNDVGTLPQKERRDFSGVSHEEALRRARALVPVLGARAQQSEDARVLLRENEQALHEAGRRDAPAEGVPLSNPQYDVSRGACIRWVLDHRSGR